MLKVYVPSGAGGRRSGQGGRPVTVVGEGHTARQRPGSRRAQPSGSALVVTVKLPAVPAVKVVLSPR